jgi:hypothetical protein
VCDRYLHLLHVHDVKGQSTYEDNKTETMYTNVLMIIIIEYRNPGFDRSAEVDG